MPRKFDFLSPGIEITEVDQSILPSDVDADGPVIIGRFRKGPGMKPAKVRSLDNFVQVYGNPVPGGSSLKGDIWRDGPQLSAPTPAAYAAQAWLASRTSPVNLVRLLGDQHSQATEAGKAGWQISGSAGVKVSAASTDNSTAYGLFVADLTDLGQSTAITLEKASDFAIGDLETTGIGLRIYHSNTATSNAGADLVASKVGGLQIEIKFDIDSGFTTAGETVRNATGAGTGTAVPLLTIKLKDTATFVQTLSAIHDALAAEVDRGDTLLKDVSLDFTANGDLSTLLIYNLSTTTELVLDGFKSSGSKDHFQADGVQYDGGVFNNRLLCNAGDVVHAAVATSAVSEGCLAAVFYCNSGYLVLDGVDADSGTTVADAGGAVDALVKSNKDNIGFQLKHYNTADVVTETTNFDFNRSSGNYIRNVFNTNPQLVNSSITATADQKFFWLGESFERALKEKVTSTTAANQVAALIPLHKDDVAPTVQGGNWGYQRKASAEAKSGYLIGRNYGSDDAKYDGASSVDKLFRFECIHAGEEIQKNVLIAIEDLKLANNPTVYAYGTFTVKIMDISGGTLEKYSGCNLDPNSPNFVARRIGDMYMEWSDTDRRYRSYGDFPNVSDYVRIKMFAEYQNYAENDLPVGFLGPGRPKSFGATEGNPEFQTLNGADFAGAYVTSQVAKLTKASNEALELFGYENAKFSFPKLPLRVNGSDGYSASPYRAYFGIRPKVDANSSLHDPDYCDYLRPLPADYAAQQFAPTGDFEYSCIFSLHDIVIVDADNTVTWTSGSMAAGTSYTSNTVGNSTEALFNKGVKQFILPLFGGFDGLDITEKEPFRQDLIGSTLSEKGNYLHYSLNKAIDSISDPETVPASLLSVPGVKNPIITSKVIRTAESRKDMLAVIDLEGDYKPTSEADTSDTKVSRLGSVSSAISSLKNRQLDSSYACAYYPAVQIQDNLNNGERVWIPSSVAGIGAMAQSDAASELWFAPAGFNRGGLGNLGGRSGPRVIQARQRLDASERDKLYEVNVNPIATFPNEGVVIFGQKTLQQTPSALDRINVRRLMIFLKAEISKVAQNILFDNNVRSTWARFTSQAEPILADVKSKFGLTEYRLVLDSSTTTPDLIDRNIMYAKVFLKPARAIEYIAIDFVITRTGAEFA